MAVPEQEKHAAVSGEQETSFPEPEAPVRAPLPEPVQRLVLPFLLRDLPTPPEVAAAMVHQERGRRLNRHDRNMIEESLKLSFYFGGHWVVATTSRDGLLIHAIDLDDPDKYHALHIRLQSQGHATVLSFYPSCWGEPDKIRWSVLE